MTIPEEKRAGYISLKEASERFGYSQDYLGQLIRKGKIEGKLVYSHVAWVTTPEAIEEYMSTSKEKRKKIPSGVDAKNLPNNNIVGQKIVSEVDSFDVDDIAPSRTATLLMIVFRVLLFLSVLAVIFVFYLLTTAFGEEIQIGSRVASASISFVHQANSSYHE